MDELLRNLVSCLSGNTVLREIWVGFWANFAADAILAIMLYVALTRPVEKRRTQADAMKALGILKAETEMNVTRARTYIGKLSDVEDEMPPLSPFRYSRGAWNALKESNFIPQLKNPRLVYCLLRMNEAATIANKNLRRLQLAFLENAGGKRRFLADTARSDSEILLSAMLRVLCILEDMSLPDFSIDYSELWESIEYDNDVDIDDETNGD